MHFKIASIVPNPTLHPGEVSQPLLSERLRGVINQISGKMALENSQILTATFEAAKVLVKKGSLTADEETILESFPQEIFDHTDLLVRRHFAEEIKFDIYDFTHRVIKM